MPRPTEAPDSAPISHVNVWPSGDELVVTWRGGSDQTSVFVSSDPEDAGIDVRAPDGQGRAVVARADNRQYIHLFDPVQGFVVAAERRVVMDGPQNFRDLGGYLTSDGSQVRWGRVFRSDGLDQMSDADHETLAALGVATVFDLRSAAEVEMSPDRLPSDVTHVHMPMSSDVAQQRGMLQRIVDGDLSKFDNDDMAAGYLRMLEGFPEYFHRVVDAVGDGRTVLFHCTAGKDRTGIMAMTLLALAGVGESDLLDDYEITSQYLTHEGSSYFADRIRAAGYDPTDYETLWQSPRQVMKSTLDQLANRWGDHAGYARHIGVSGELADRARLQLRAKTV